MPKLKLELNKQYRDNFGGVVTLVSLVTPDHPIYAQGYRFLDQFGNAYKEDGHWMSCEGEARPLSPLVALADDNDVYFASASADEDFFPMCMSLTDDFLNSSFYQPDSQTPDQIAAAAIVFAQHELMFGDDTCEECGGPLHIEHDLPQNVIPGEPIGFALRRMLELYLEMREIGFDQTSFTADGRLFGEPSKPVIRFSFVEKEDYCHWGIDVLDPRIETPEIMPKIMQQALDFIEKEHATLVLKKKNRLH